MQPTNTPPNQQPANPQAANQPVAPQPAKPPVNQAPQQPVLSTPNFGSQIKFISSVVDNMLSGANKRLMIGGDTGLGKSTFVKQFAKIFGFPTVIVEIPHTVEEQLINIPFIVFDATGKTQQGYDQIEKDDAKVILGTSHLASTLRKITKLSNQQYLATVKSYDSFTQELIRQYEEANPGEIDLIRSRYQRILFLDEYYRQTTPAIRNILRNVLNGRIGNDVIPEGTYVMYASNLEDVGGSMDPQSQHTTFINKRFAAPSKEQWLNYTVSNAINKKVQFKQEVIDAFNKNLRDEHISYNDVDTGLRTSPRRWSEILLYINNAYPFKSPSEVGILFTTIGRQFKSEEGQPSALYNLIRDILADLCVKSGIDISTVKAVPPTEWRKVLAQQIMTTLTVGESKKYVPVIQGLPGVGKTAIGAMFENPPYNLRFIPVLATTLTRDSVIGIPLPDKSDGEQGVRFAEPELYTMIMNMIAKSEELYRQSLAKQESEGKLGEKTAEQVYKEFQQQKYKYMIFFDEINRVKDVSIFNSLRRIILEKEFNDQFKLPKEAVILGAMNPSDLGTQPLTAHFRDAIDLIDVEASWPDLMKYIKNATIPKIKSSNNPAETSIDTALKIIEGFPTEFTTKKRGRASNEFYVNVGVEEVYLSPRDYENLFQELVAGINRKINNISRNLNQGADFTDEEINNEIVEAAFEKLEGTLDERFYQAQIGEPPGFYDKLKQFLNNIIDVSLTKQTKNLGLSGILKSIGNGNRLADNFDFDNYMSSYMPATFRKDFDEYLMNEIKYQNKDDLVLVVNAIVEAVNENEFDPDILDRIDDAIHTHLEDMIITEFKGKNSSEQVNTAESIGLTYQEVLDALGR